MISSRRKFIAQSSALAAFAISGTKSSGNIIGANERINVAVCGIKSRGSSHIGGHGRQKNVCISHLVDPDSRLYEGRKKFVTNKFKNTPECVAVLLPLRVRELEGCPARGLLGFFLAFATFWSLSRC